MPSDVFPVFTRVKVIPADVTPTTTCPKAAVGVSVAPVTVPKPLRGIKFGLLAAFDVMLKLPVSVPAEVGEKIPFIVQVAFGATVAQVVVREKFPVAVTPEITKDAVPQLVTVTARLPELVPTDWFPKFTDAGLKHTAGEVAIPVPLKAAVDGLPGAFVAIDKVADRAPAPAGLNTMEKVQDAPGETVLLQVVVFEKSPEFAPLIVALAIVNGPVPWLVSTTVDADEAVPIV